MHNLKIDSIDLFCLTLILLLTPNDNVCLKNPAIIENVKNKIIYLFQQYDNRNYNILSNLFTTEEILSFPNTYIPTDLAIQSQIPGKFGRMTTNLLKVEKLSEEFINSIQCLISLLPINNIPNIIKYILNSIFFLNIN